MNRQEKRRKVRVYQKELDFIKRHTPYLEFKLSGEFKLPEEEIGLLMDGIHQDKKLQERFYLAKDLFARVDALNDLISGLSTKKEACQSTKVDHKSLHQT